MKDILIFLIFVFGFFLGIAFTIGVFEVLMAGDPEIHEEYYLDNIKFIVKPNDEIKEMWFDRPNVTNETNNSSFIFGFSTVINEDGKWKKLVAITAFEDKEQFLMVCNHEVMHHVFDFPNATNEEEYIRALDNYVRFPVCERLYQEAYVNDH